MGILIETSGVEETCSLLEVEPLYPRAGWALVGALVGALCGAVGFVCRLWRLSIWDCLSWLIVVLRVCRCLAAIFFGALVATFEPMMLYLGLRNPEKEHSNI
jgi:hypothetical protein